MVWRISNYAGEYDSTEARGCDSGWKRQMLSLIHILGLQVGCSGGAAPTTQAALDQKAEETKAAGESKEAASQESTPIWVAIREDINNFPEGTMDILKESVKEKFNVDLKIDCISPVSYTHLYISCRLLLRNIRFIQELTEQRGAEWPISKSCLKRNIF